MIRSEDFWAWFNDDNSVKTFFKCMKLLPFVLNVSDKLSYYIFGDFQ